MRRFYKAFKSRKNNIGAGLIEKEAYKEIIHEEGSIEWIRNRNLKYDNEQEMYATKDNGLWTKRTMNMYSQATDKTFRMSNDKVETTSHLLSACQTLLAMGIYTNSNNNIWRLVHYKNLEHLNLTRPFRFWEHEPKRITTNAEVDIYIMTT